MISTSDSMPPLMVGRKVTDIESVLPAPIVNGPVGATANSPPMAGIEIPNAPFPLFRSTTCLVTELFTRATSETEAGADNTPAWPVPISVTSVVGCAGSLPSISNSMV